MPVHAPAIVVVGADLYRSLHGVFEPGLQVALDCEVLRIHSEAAIPRGDRLPQLAPALRFGTGVYALEPRTAVDVHGVVRLVESVFPSTRLTAFSVHAGHTGHGSRNRGTAPREYCMSIRTRYMSCCLPRLFRARNGPLPRS